MRLLLRRVCILPLSACQKYAGDLCEEILRNSKLLPHPTPLTSIGRASTNHTAKTKTKGKKKEGSGSAYVSWQKGADLYESEISA